MWLFLGISAIIFTGFNLIFSFKSKNEKWFRFAALSFTALTVCSFYSDGAMRVLNEDWGGLMDIMPTMSKALWVCVGISILLDFIYCRLQFRKISTSSTACKYRDAKKRA